MHILQINTEKGWRGGERQTLLSMEGLRDAGIKVTLLCLQNQPLCAKATAAGFPVISVGSQIAAMRHCILRGNNYSILHAQSSRAFGFTALAKLFTKTPLVYTRRVDFVPRGGLTKWKYHRATALVAISRAIRDILHNSSMGEASIISDIVSGHVPDTSRQAALQEELHLDKRPVVGVIAALAGHKDPLTMINAAAHVRDHFPDVVFLHFGDGKLRSAAEDACTRLNLQGTYHLLGHRENVEDYFPLFKCFAMSSAEEGLGSTVLDAFDNGVPVASTRAGGLTELVEGRGLLSAIGNPEELAANICTLLEDRTLALHLAETAKAYVISNHSRPILTEKYLDLYRRLADQADF